MAGTPRGHRRAQPGPELAPDRRALLLTGLLQPLKARLLRAGLPGLALYIMGAPLVIPLAVLVFVAAVILPGVLIVEDQLEGHLLQPQVVGRVIRLHPLAVILSLAVGGVLAGIAGAVVAVPIVAVITRAVPELRREDPGPGGP